MWIQTCKGDAEFRDAFGDSVSCTGVSKDQGQTIEALVLTDESAQLLVGAGNAHEQTSLMPAQLAADLAAAQQEIARLRAALERAGAQLVDCKYGNAYETIREALNK